jgi:hypothetical protein
MAGILYYSSAAPQSGYTAAVRGYAQKLGAALAMRVEQVADVTPEILAGYDTPQITIGIGEAFVWPGVGQPLALKARPYADQHGFGPSMHALNLTDLEGVIIPGCLTLVVANPAWLVTEDFCTPLKEWMQRHDVTQLNLSASPRTNPLLWDEMVQHWPQHFPVPVQVNPWHPARGGGNPYRQMLAQAQWLMLLGTSRSMAGEMALCRVPVVLRGDDAQSDARFFEAVSGVPQLAGRYLPFDPAQQVPPQLSEPFDVTMPYVEEAVAAYRLRRPQAA